MEPNCSLPTRIVLTVVAVLCLGWSMKKVRQYDADERVNTYCLKNGRIVYCYGTEMNEPVFPECTRDFGTNSWENIHKANAFIEEQERVRNTYYGRLGGVEVDVPPRPSEYYDYCYFTVALLFFLMWICPPLRYVAYVLLGLALYNHGRQE